MHPLTAVGAIRWLLPTVAAIVVGGLVALQAQINGQLADHMGGGVAGGIDAAIISLGVGLLLLLALTGSVPRYRRGLVDVVRSITAGRLRPWQITGGFFGGVLVASQGLTVSTIGVALFTVLVVAGQTANGLLIDHAGLGPLGARRVTGGRIVAAVLAVVAVLLSVSQHLGGGDTLTGAGLALAALPLLAGIGVAFQQAFNGHVAMVGGPTPAALVNFAIGIVTCVVFWCLVRLVAGGADVAQSVPLPWESDGWLLLGGPLGVVFIVLFAALARTINVLVLGLCSVAGQIIVALVIDLVTGATEVGLLTVSGSVLILIGLAIAALSDRARPGREHGEAPRRASVR